MKNTQRFENLTINYFGMHSSSVRAYGVLADEELSDAAFKSLVKTASLEGSLYALAGTFYTDQAYFYETANKLKSSELKLRRGRGCFIQTISLAEAIESKKENVAIIGSGESFEQYMVGANGRRTTLDLINGGFPAALKHYVEKQKERSLWKRSTLPLE